MPRIKPSFDGSQEAFAAGAGFYDGPPPIPSTYRGVVKKMGLAKIKTGVNAGGDRIALVLEITDGKFKGAGILHSLNLTTQGAPFVNQFLEALTDGTDEQRTGIRKAFWQIGYDVAEAAEGKLGKPFIRIGKKTNPIGMPIAFVTKMGNDLDGNERAEIARFLVTVAPPVDADEEEDSLDESPSEPGKVEDETSSEVSDDDDDDPWS